MTIAIHYDRQDPHNEGWAFRDDREGSPLGSASIDGRAAEFLDALDAGCADSRDDGALRALLADYGIDPSLIVFHDSNGRAVGNPWPAVDAWRLYDGDSEIGATWLPADDGIFDA